MDIIKRLNNPLLFSLVFCCFILKLPNIAPENQAGGTLSSFFNYIKSI